MTVKKPSTNAVVAENENNVADFAEAQAKAGKIRVRLSSPVAYNGEQLTTLWMRRPVLMDGIIAFNQTDGNSSTILYSMVSQCIGVDLEWFWEQKPAATNKLLDAYLTRLKDPVYLPDWDGLTLKLFKPLQIKDKMVDSVTLTEPTTRDLMDESSKEKMYQMLGRLLGLAATDIRDMDYLHDYDALVEKINSFRNA